MKTATIDGKNYIQTNESWCGTCKNCIANVYSQEADVLCKELSNESGNDCEDAIWKEEPK